MATTTRTKKKKTQAKKASTTAQPKSGLDLGTASGIREERPSHHSSMDDYNDGGRTFMHDQREEDALEAKLGAAAKLIKSGHGYVAEMNLHYRIARSATATQAVIRANLERIEVLGQDIIESAKASIEALGR